MKLKYVGTRIIPGVPARDLTDAEAKQHGVKALVATGLYIAVKEPKPKSKSEVNDG